MSFMKTKQNNYEAPQTQVFLVSITHPLLDSSSRVYPLSSSESFDSDFESIGW